MSSVQLSDASPKTGPGKVSPKRGAADAPVGTLVDVDMKPKATVVDYNKDKHKVVPAKSPESSAVPAKSPSSMSPNAYSPPEQLALRSQSTIPERSIQEQGDSPVNKQSVVKNLSQQVKSPERAIEREEPISPKRDA